MIKLTSLLIEIHKEQQIEEGWKENILATIFSAASLFGGVKGQSSNQNPIKPGIEQQVNNSLTIDIGSIFSSGRYLINGEKSKELINKLVELGQYINKNPNIDYKVQIISSESQVPNKDAEKPGTPSLGVGELAQKRADIANFAISNYIQDLKDKGKFKGNIKIEIAPILIGKEKFRSGIDNKDDVKYTKDQFVKIKITAIPKSTQQPLSDKYSIYSEEGEIIYSGNKAVAIIFYPSRKSSNIKQSGGLNTSYQDVLLRKVKPDVQLTGKRTQQGVYIQDYIIPSDIWNAKTSGTHNLTPELLNSFEKYKVN